MVSWTEGDGVDGDDKLEEGWEAVVDDGGGGGGGVEEDVEVEEEGESE
jgi:hypothetical protein